MRIRPNKRLGQNFLVDNNIKKKIFGLCGISADDIVLEIGSGSGQMTEALAAKAKKVYALEIDKRLYLELKRKLKTKENVVLINEDFLKFDLARRIKEGGKIKIFVNQNDIFLGF